MKKQVLLNGLMIQPLGVGGIAVVYLSLLALLYRESYTRLWNQWQAADLSYGMLVPLVVAYLIWENREQLARVPYRFTWLGFIPLLLGILCYWLGELGGEYYSLLLSSWLVLVGLCLIHLGWAKVREIGFALLIIPVMFPFPAIINNQITLKLKLISSQVGVKLLHLYGMSAYREGNVIDLGFTQLQVVDACSGLRYLFPILIVGLLLGYFFRLTYWKWALLVVFTVPVIILNNGLRIAATGVLYEIFGPVVAEGFFHDFAGWFTFMTAFALLLPVVLLLRRGRRRKADSREELIDNGLIARSPSFVVVGLVVLLLAGSLAVAQGVEFREKIPLKKALSHFPLTLEKWHGQNQYLEQIYVNALDFSDYTIINYRDGDNNLINFYVAYYENQRKGESIHSPSSCLPGGGWELSNSRVVALKLQGRKRPVDIMRAEMRMGDRRQLVYYWFLQRGRYLTKAYELKLYGFWDALSKQRTDGALVRLIGDIRAGEAVAEAEERMQHFTIQLIPILDGFIPGEKG